MTRLLFHSRRRERGLSLVELMVAMAIGVFLIGGAITVFIGSRSTYLTADTIARIQENARFAMQFLEPDIQQAGFWGNHTEPNVIENRASAGGTIAVGNDCDANWTISVGRYLEGSNNSHPGWSCLPTARYIDQTDILTIRRAGTGAVDAVDLEDGQVYLRSSELPRSRLFVGNAQPAGFPTTAENFPLITRAYYVSPYTVGESDDMPSLRRLDLVNNGGVASIVDTEVVPGVEDMQVQFGVDTNPGIDTSVDRYVNPDSALLTGATPAAIRAVRLWLLIRAEKEELGYVDDKGYTLGDVDRAPANDGYRRILVSKTVFLRNR